MKHAYILSGFNPNFQYSTRRKKKNRIWKNKNWDRKLESRERKQRKETEDFIRFSRNTLCIDLTSFIFTISSQFCNCLTACPLATNIFPPKVTIYLLLKFSFFNTSKTLLDFTFLYFLLLYVTFVFALIYFMYNLTKDVLCFFFGSSLNKLISFKLTPFWALIHLFGRIFFELKELH